MKIKKILSLFKKEKKSSDDLRRNTDEPESDNVQNTAVLQRPRLNEKGAIRDTSIMEVSHLVLSMQQQQNSFFDNQTQKINDLYSDVSKQNYNNIKTLLDSQDKFSQTLLSGVHTLSRDNNPNKERDKKIKQRQNIFQDKADSSLKNDLYNNLYNKLNRRVDFLSNDAKKNSYGNNRISSKRLKIKNSDAAEVTKPKSLDSSYSDLKSVYKKLNHQNNLLQDLNGKISSITDGINKIKPNSRLQEIDKNYFISHGEKKAKTLLKKNPTKFINKAKINDFWHQEDKKTEKVFNGNAITNQEIYPKRSQKSFDDLSCLIKKSLHKKEFDDKKFFKDSDTKYGKQNSLSRAPLTLDKLNNISQSINQSTHENKKLNKNFISFFENKNPRGTDGIKSTLNSKNKEAGFNKLNSKEYFDSIKKIPNQFTKRKVLDDNTDFHKAPKKIFNKLDKVSGSLENSLKKKDDIKEKLDDCPVSVKSADTTNLKCRDKGNFNRHFKDQHIKDDNNLLSNIESEKNDNARFLEGEEQVNQNKPIKSSSQNTKIENLLASLESTINNLSDTLLSNSLKNKNNTHPQIIEKKQNLNKLDDDHFKKEASVTIPKYSENNIVKVKDDLILKISELKSIMDKSLQSKINLNNKLDKLIADGKKLKKVNKKTLDKVNNNNSVLEISNIKDFSSQVHNLLEDVKKVSETKNNKQYITQLLDLKTNLEKEQKLFLTELKNNLTASNVEQEKNFSLRQSLFDKLDNLEKTLQQNLNQKNKLQKKIKVLSDEKTFVQDSKIEKILETNTLINHGAKDKKYNQLSSSKANDSSKALDEELISAATTSHKPLEIPTNNFIPIKTNEFVTDYVEEPPIMTYCEELKSSLINYILEFNRQQKRKKSSFLKRRVRAQEDKKPLESKELKKIIDSCFECYPKLIPFCSDEGPIKKRDFITLFEKKLLEREKTKCLDIEIIYDLLLNSLDKLEKIHVIKDDDFEVILKDNSSSHKDKKESYSDEKNKNDGVNSLQPSDLKTSDLNYEDTTLETGTKFSIEDNKTPNINLNQAIIRDAEYADLKIDNDTDSALLLPTADKNDESLQSDDIMNNTYFANQSDNSLPTTFKSEEVIKDDAKAKKNIATTNNKALEEYYIMLKGVRNQETIDLFLNNIKLEDLKNYNALKKIFFHFKDLILQNPDYLAVMIKELEPEVIYKAIYKEDKFFVTKLLSFILCDKKQIINELYLQKNNFISKANKLKAQNLLLDLVRDQIFKEFTQQS